MACFNPGNSILDLATPRVALRKSTSSRECAMIEVQS
jgi:hypothetical protein